MLLERNFPHIMMGWRCHRNVDSAKGVADSKYEPISLDIGTSFKFLQNHTAIQQRPAKSLMALDHML